MVDLSKLELMKRDDLQFEVVDESDYDDEDDDGQAIFEELAAFDDSEDDDDDDNENAFL